MSPDLVKVNQAMREAEKLGGWAQYTAHHLGMAETGDKELDTALTNLYNWESEAYRRGNIIAHKYDLAFYGNL